MVAKCNLSHFAKRPIVILAVVAVAELLNTIISYHTVCNGNSVQFHPRVVKKICLAPHVRLMCARLGADGYLRFSLVSYNWWAEMLNGLCNIQATADTSAPPRTFLPTIEHAAKADRV